VTRLVIVDDHPVFRHGLVALFESNGFEVVGQAAGAAEAIAVVSRERPDVVLLDLGLPDGRGVDVAARLTGMLPEARVVVVTMYDDDGSVREAIAAGATGYVVKDASPAQLVAAVRAAEQGAVVLGSGVAPAAGLRVRAPAADPFGLTPRERDVLDLLVRGLSNPQIAERLAVSGKTVSNNVSTLLAKLGAVDRAEAARIAREIFGG
jgi:DNA-binding NarL/FixJ family response regulator